MTDWLILRTKGSSTLRLARSLTDSGMEAWTPVEVQVRRRRQRSAKPEQITVPLLPYFVFARAVHLADLVELSRSSGLMYQIWDSGQRRMVLKGHPEFWLWHPFGDYAIIPDDELIYLRMAERTRKPRGKPKIFQPGDKVRLTDGAYEGLTGTVESVRGKFVMVMLPKATQAIKISAWLPILDERVEVHVSSDQPEQRERFRDAA